MNTPTLVLLGIATLCLCLNFDTNSDIMLIIQMSVQNVGGHILYGALNSSYCIGVNECINIMNQMFEQNSTQLVGFSPTSNNDHKYNFSAFIVTFVIIYAILMFVHNTIYKTILYRYLIEYLSYVTIMIYISITIGLSWTNLSMRTRTGLLLFNVVIFGLLLIRMIKNHCNPTSQTILDHVNDSSEYGNV